MKFYDLAPGGVFLAWAQLRFQGRRLLAALSGIIIVTTCTLFQIGVYTTFFESSVALIRHFNADLVLISTSYRCFLVQRGFSEEILVQALGQPGVESVSRVAAFSAFWSDPEKRTLQDSTIIGIIPSEKALTFPNAEQQRDILKSAETVVFDTESIHSFGPIAQRLREGGPFYGELGRHRVRIAGTFEMGPSFAMSGSFMTGMDNFYRLLPVYRPGEITYGLIKLQPGQDPHVVAVALQKRLPADVQVLTLSEMVKHEQDFWNEFTPIGFIIPVTLFISLAVGGVVIYQILYTSVNDHLKEYATMKAIGYSDLSLCGIVLQQAIILTLIGFPVGLVASFGLFQIAREQTGLPFEILWQHALLSLVLTGLTSFLAGIFALNKLRQVDPADVFA